MLFSDTFSVGGGRLAADAAHPDPVGSPRRTAEIESTSQRDVRIGVARAGDLVEQLGGDGVGADQSAGAGVFGDDRGAVGGDLGDREAGVVRGWKFR